MKEDDVLNSLQERIGEKLIELRRKKGYTSHETFAHDFDLPRGQYWKIEHGRTNLTLRTLVRLLTIHQTTVDAFFAEINKEGKKKKP